jgi:hypothetical protein
MHYCDATVPDFNDDDEYPPAADYDEDFDYDEEADDEPGEPEVTEQDDIE